MKSGFLDSGGRGSNHKKKSNVNVTGSSCLDYDFPSLREVVSTLANQDRVLSKGNTFNVGFAGQAAEGTVVPSGVSVATISLVNTGTPNEVNMGLILFVNVVNIVPMSSTMNGSEQVVQEVIMNDMPASYANKLSTSSLNKANLWKNDGVRVVMKETIRVKYEREPPHCSTRLIFSHSVDDFPKALKRVVNRVDNDKGGLSEADDDGFTKSSLIWNFVNNNWYWSWNKSYEHKDIYVFAVISIGANIHSYAGISSWTGKFFAVYTRVWKNWFSTRTGFWNCNRIFDIDIGLVCGYSSIWDFLVFEINECLGKKAISDWKLDFLYNCDYFILMVLWFPIIFLTSEVMVCYIDHFHGIFLEDLSHGVNNMGSESVTNEVEMAGVSEVSHYNLENMELIDEENMPNDLLALSVYELDEKEYTPEEVIDVSDSQDLDLAIDDGHFFTNISNEGSQRNQEFGSLSLAPDYLCLPLKSHLWLNCNNLNADDVVPADARFPFPGET
uniref:Uncharacterized protein n=1 Tax=Tanacetum cinerariifolium TaxID=118510 RepID=A0A699GRU8_TANCI|nr:hypothetical protein [Tanacetum cinerariifolium]